MTRRTIAQRAFALTLTVALMAPWAAAVQCDQDDCCASMAAAHMHQAASDVVTSAGSPDGCSVMSACAPAPSAATPHATAVLVPMPDGNIAERTMPPAFQSFLAAPSAPPPKT